MSRQGFLTAVAFFEVLAIGVSIKTAMHFKDHPSVHEWAPWSYAAVFLLTFAAAEAAVGVASFALARTVRPRPRP